MKKILIGNRCLTIKTKKEMKKNLFMVAAVALMALVSCNKEEINNGVQEPASDIVFVAEFEQEADTKIALGDLVDGVRKTTWVSGDKIKINGTEFTAKEDGERVEFTTTSSSFDETKTTFRAVYPSSSWQSATSATIPATQDGTFASASIAVAESSTKALKFQNLVTILKFQVPESCSTVTFESTASIAGRITVNYSDGNMTPDYAQVTNGSSKITLSGSFIPETDYYVAVKPGTHKFTVSIDGEVSKASTKAVTVERSKILNMGVLPVPVPPTTIYLVPGVWASDNAWFAAHFFGDGVQEDKKMDDSDGDGIYEVTVPYGATGVIFCRMNPKFTEFAWNNDGEEEHVWNQTENLTVPASDATEVYYVVTGWAAGAWKTYDDATAAPVIGLVGSFQGWNLEEPVAMTDNGDGWIVAKNVELYKTDEFKFATGNSWDNPSFGTSEFKVLEENVEIDVVQGGQNMKVSKNGKYNLYLNPNANKVKVECVEEYTDLKVNITIDNKANWSPLTITLKEGNKVIADKATVTGNKYSISGDYIGSTLTCQFFSNSKQSAVMNVAITKNGATVTLEETVIKLKVQLNTANAKQWWGDTMKIHAWDTGTSFDTSWPGNTMTSEGNYTWSVIVPSELVGKTIKFLVHNGNGWQSKDATVTIAAEGNTVTGSSIGIN